MPFVALMDTDPNCTELTRSPKWCEKFGKEVSKAASCRGCLYDNLGRRTVTSNSSSGSAFVDFHLVGVYSSVHCMNNSTMPKNDMITYEDSDALLPRGAL